MRDQDYSAWAVGQGKVVGTGKLSVTTARTRVTDAQRVEKLYGDLDQHFEADGLETVLQALKYSKADRDQDAPNPTLLPIQGDLYTGLAASRMAVRHYAAFVRAQRPQSSTRNPNWTRDELVLALEAYTNWDGQPPGHHSAEMAGLSADINALCQILGGVGDRTLRNTNGVYMKIMNFRRFDPQFKDSGRSGLENGGQLEEDVWRDFHSDPAALRAAAAAIRQALGDPASAEASANRAVLEANEGVVGIEGALLTAVHLRRERSRKVVEAKKQRVLAQHGELACEVCDFVFAERYGERGRHFIECHHTRPLAERRESSATRLADLALVCANCHRMIHARSPFLTIAELQQLIGGQTAVAS